MLELMIITVKIMIITNRDDDHNSSDDHKSKDYDHNNRDDKLDSH